MRFAGKFCKNARHMSTVTTRYGKIAGEEQDGLYVFKGVPFAAPPVGPLRWLPPQPPASWNGVREAGGFGPTAPQNPSLLAAMKTDGEQSEDCLYLNVWTPGADRARRPVMVWIHGGGFSTGGAAQSIYDGRTLARRGNVVVVTINYRLGPLGFLRLNDLTNGKIPSTGNEGVLDQIAALRWVRDNIAEFGGDPENVTVFGESAGGMSVGTLLAADSARGLFHKAIPQSGACNTGKPAEAANLTAERVLARLGLPAADSIAIRAAAPADLLKGTLSSAGTPDRDLGMAYQPVVDGVLLSRTAIEMVANGSASGVAVMVGSNLEEWKLFSAFDPSTRELDRARLSARTRKRLTADLAEPLIAAYEAARARREAAIDPPELFAAIETDRVFRIPAVRLAEVHSRREPRVFNYLFTWQSPAMRGALGACHALELGFVFGTNHVEGMTRFAGSGPTAEKLAREMQDAWLAFAHSGDPSCAGLGPWPAYTEERRATMLFGATTIVEDAPLDDERRAWEKIPANALGSL